MNDQPVNAQRADDDDPTNFGSIPSYVIDRMTEFQKTIPFVIGAVAIGVGTVNRTVLKSLMHLSISIVAALLAKIIADLGVTAFLFSSIAYIVACCLNVNGNVDTSIKISMPIGFGILWFIDMYVTKLNFTVFPYLPYFGTALLSAMWGICWFYILNKLAPNNGKSLLYDFKGCSCDDCANANTCPANGLNNQRDTNNPNSNKTVLMGRIIKQ